MCIHHHNLKSGVIRKKEKMIVPVLATLILSFSSPLHVIADDSYGKFVWYEDSYSFSNGSWESGDMLEEHEQTLLAHMQNTEKWTSRRMRGHEYRGSCYGMAATSVLACYDLIDYRLYTDKETPVTSLYALADVGADREGHPGITTYSLINYYQQLQARDVLRQASIRQVYERTQPEQMQYLLACLADGSPAVIAFQGWSDRPTQQGMQYVHTSHALVAVGTEEGSYTSGSMTFDRKVVLYDDAGLYIPGFGTAMQTNCLYYHSQTYDWYLPVYGIGSQNGGTLDFICDDIALLNDGGLCSGTEPYQSDEAFISVLAAGAADSGYTVTTDDMTVPADMVQTHAAYNDGGSDMDVNYLLPGDERGYILTADAPQRLHTAMFYQDSIQLADAESGSGAQFSPEGCVSVSGNSGTYRLESVYNEGYHNEAWYDITVSGTAETASLARTADGFVLTADRMQDVTVNVRNDEQEMEVTFSADVPSVLLSKSQWHTLCVSTDTDGDGSYETILTEAGIHHGGVVYLQNGEELTAFTYDDHLTSEVCIPDEIGGLPVTAVAAEAFLNCSEIVLVNIGRNVERIDDRAFAGCAISGLYLHDGIEEIGAYAFSDLRRLKGLVIPRTVREIGEGAFSGDWVYSVYLADGVTRIGENAFKDCDRLEFVSLPDSLTSIAGTSFSGCTALTTLQFTGHAEEWRMLSSDCAFPPNLSVLCECGKPTAARDPHFIPGEDHYSFKNYDGDYGLTEQDAELLFSKLTKHESGSIKAALNHGAGGFCYAFAATSLLTVNGYLDPAALQEDAACLHDLAFDEKVHSLLSYYHLMQGTDLLSDWSAAGAIGEDTLADLIESVRDGTPAVVEIGWTMDGRPAGHAVLAYGVEYGQWEQCGKAYDGRVLLYDSNLGFIRDDAHLYFQSATGECIIPGYVEQHGADNFSVGVAVGDARLLNTKGLLETGVLYAPTVLLGDPDGSGEVNAADASLILASAASAGLGGEDGLSDMQRITSDVNSDGEINAVDASLVLCYAAETGLGTFSGTLEEFIKR